MTVPPPPPPSQPVPPARLSGLAIASMVLGILSFCLSILTAIPAIVLGIIAVVKINKEPHRYGGSGMAIAGIVTGAIGGLMVMPVMIAILLPSLGRARELANRAACSANLTGMVKSMVIYAQDNADQFPAPPAPATPGGFATATGIVGPSTDPDDTLKTLYSPGQSTYADTRANVTDPLWMLVLNGQMSSRPLVCKSDPASAGPSRITDPSNNHYYLTPESGRAISYSIAYPYTASGHTGPWWRNNTFSDLPLIADMAPMVDTGSPPRHPAALTLADAGSRRQWNSANHGGDGQEVAFGDAHVEWANEPTVGTLQLAVVSGGGSSRAKITGRDNIWAAWDGTQHALPPTGPLTLPDNVGHPMALDVIMVPARNVSNGTLSAGGGSN